MIFLHVNALRHVFNAYILDLSSRIKICPTHRPPFGGRRGRTILLLVLRTHSIHNSTSVLVWTVRGSPSQPRGPLHIKRLWVRNSFLLETFYAVACVTRVPSSSLISMAVRIVPGGSSVFARKALDSRACMRVDDLAVYRQVKFSLAEP